MKLEIKDEIALKVKAGMPIIQLVSYEWRRIQGLCIQAAEKSEKNLFMWNNVDGLRKWDLIDRLEKPENEELRDPIEALAWFKKNSPERSILLIEDLHLYFDHPSFREIFGYLRTIAKSETREEKENVLILAQPVRYLPAELEKDVYVIDIPLPGKDVLMSIIKEAVEDIDIPEESAPLSDRNKLAEAARGLTIVEAQYVFREIAISQNKLTENEVPLIIKEKEQIIKKSGILEYYHPSETISDVGGMEKLKEWLKRRKGGFEPEIEQFGMTAPKGVLLLGVQGCGKSMIAKAIASEWSLPLLKFDIGRVFGGIVGESENNIRRALETAKAIAPSILWIDEIEKGFSGISSSGSTDGGTTARVFGTMLTWMQEKKDPVFVIATANNIEQLPPELLRKGRFDEIFFVDLPGFESRKDIWGIHLKKRLGAERFSRNDYDLDKLAKISSGYSGAEIEEAINEGLYQAHYEERDLEMKDLEISVQKTVPLSKVMGERIEELRKWSRVRAQLASDENVEQSKCDEKQIPRLSQERYSKPLFE